MPAGMGCLEGLFYLSHSIQFFHILFPAFYDKSVYTAACGATRGFGAKAKPNDGLTGGSKSRFHSLPGSMKPVRL